MLNVPISINLQAPSIPRINQHPVPPTPWCQFPWDVQCHWIITTCWLPLGGCPMQIRADEGRLQEKELQLWALRKYWCLNRSQIKKIYVRSKKNFDSPWPSEWNFKKLFLTTTPHADPYHKCNSLLYIHYSSMHINNECNELVFWKYSKLVITVSAQ